MEKFNIKNSEIKELLSCYLDAYQSMRQSGHTTKALEIAANSDARIVCMSESHARDLRGRGAKTIVFNRAMDFRGINCPLIWDNAALIEVFWASRYNIETLEKELAKAEAGLSGTSKENTWRKFKRWLYGKRG